MAGGYDDITEIFIGILYTPCLSKLNNLGSNCRQRDKTIKRLSGLGIYRLTDTPPDTQGAHRKLSVNSQTSGAIIILRKFSGNSQTSKV
jgi:hypothetical protein